LGAFGQGSTQRGIQRQKNGCSSQGISVPQNNHGDKRLAKKIGVLETDANPSTDKPRIFVKKSVAALMIRRLEARRVYDASGNMVKHLIQMVKIKAAESIKTIRAWYSGPAGRGNILPFSRPTDPKYHYHYPIPMAGDVGLWRHFRKRPIFCSKITPVSARTSSIQAALNYLRTTTNTRLSAPIPI